MNLRFIRILDLVDFLLDVGSEVIEGILCVLEERHDEGDGVRDKAKAGF